MEKYLPNPCTQDCPERRAECAAACGKYKEYEIDKFRRYAAQERARESRCFTNDAERRERRNEQAERHRTQNYRRKKYGNRD